MREELEKFLIATDELEDKQLKILGWTGPKAALEAIKQDESFPARRLAIADYRN
jgi:hypothetical protein